MPTALAIASLAALAALLLLAERRLVLRRRREPLLPRLLINLVMAALAFVLAVTLVRPLVGRLLGWTGETPFGLVPLLPLPPPLPAFAAFLLMDLSFYYWHLANHRVPLLWRFHNVHHTDPDLDVSTALRFHFGEIAFSAGFRAVQVVTIGVSPGTFLAYELVFQANTLFHHSNLRLPIRGERLLNKLLVTPRMHGIHHSQVEGETNSNYSVVFSWWDRLHRSLRLNVPQAAVIIGVPAYQTPDDNSLGSLLVLPFRRQRDYWRGADGSRPLRDPAELAGKASELAE